MTHYVYLIHSHADGGQWKIGITSRRAKDRLNDMSTGNPNLTGVYAEYEAKNNNGHQIESTIKRFYKQFKINGEWFRYEALTPDSFLEKCKKLDEVFTIIKNSTNTMI